MNLYILPLVDRQANLETVGGKGMSLAKLANAGLPVPGGFHITTEAYRAFVSANNLQKAIHEALQAVDPARPATLETASQTIKALFDQAKIPGELANAIVSAYTALPGSNPAVAVRSSATAEDLPGASFAGQQETYLNISGAGEVLQAVQKCWASLWTARAIGYRARQGIGEEAVALAVVVQLLVDAEAAGILFTANPLNGNHDEAMINAAWGLGEAVVGGVVTPDTLMINTSTGNVIHRETAEKRVMTVRTEMGTQEQVVPAALQTVPVLSDDQAAELARLGAQIEALYEMPMDIEWTLCDGAFAIVQARPITAMPEAPIEWKPLNPKATYMRGSVADLMPAPLSPLFATLVIPEMRAQIQTLGKELSGSEPGFASDYFTSINQYAYVNPTLSPKTWWWILTSGLSLFGKVFKMVPLWREELQPRYQAFASSKQDLEPECMTAEGLWDETQGLVKAAAAYICGLLFATMGSSAGAEMVVTGAYNKLAKREGDPDASVLMMGWDNIPVRAEKSLYDLAQWVRQNESLSTFLLATPSEELVALLKHPDGSVISQFQEFAARFLKHMESFGYIVFQLDFVEPLPRDHPEMMVETIKMYLRGEGKNPYERQEASEQKRIRTVETMQQRLRGLKRWAFKKALSWGQPMAEVREDALAEIGLAYPQIRALLRELGQRFVEAGAIQQAEDVYWLEKDEISADVTKLGRSQSLESLARLVEKRKAFNRRVRQVSPPPTVPPKKRIMGVKVDAFLAQTEESQTGNLLKGVATSSGKVTASARVIRGPGDFDQMRPGEVLVAGTTTPAWTPLFAMASAVVTDIGGPLSHGSIVAREYGIPAVMGTGVATKRIQSGQVITVDGTQGEVILKTKKNGQ